MSTEVKARPQERLLEAAATLTYSSGVGIGVDALCKAAGVSKRSMYQLIGCRYLAVQIELKDQSIPRARWPGGSRRT